MTPNELATLIDNDLDHLTILCNSIKNNKIDTINTEQELKWIAALRSEFSDV